MLLFIDMCLSGKNSVLNISIHLMLLFISERGSNENANRYFNTSHVTVYPILLNRMIDTSRNFNTSHVTVYPYHGVLGRNQY